jgi:hypothetical protein
MGKYQHMLVYVGIKAAIVALRRGLRVSTPLAKQELSGEYTFANGR